MIEDFRVGVDDAVLDDLRHRHHRDAVLLGEHLEVREARRRSVVVQHFADDRDGRQAGQAREVLAEMVSVWGELDSLEKDHGLSFLREPDLGFAWTAQAWARGKPLTAVLCPDLTPGAFVPLPRQGVDIRKGLLKYP